MKIKKKRAGLLRTSTKYGLLRCNKARHKPLVKAGRRNLARGRGSQEQAKSLTYPVEGLLVASQF